MAGNIDVCIHINGSLGPGVRVPVVVIDDECIGSLRTHEDTRTELELQPASRIGNEIMQLEKGSPVRTRLHYSDPFRHYSALYGQGSR